MSKAIEIQSNKIFDQAFTVAVSASESDILNLHGAKLVGFIIPSNLTATYINFLASDSETGTFDLVKVNTAAFPPVDQIKAFNVGQGYYPVIDQEFLALQFIKIKTVDVSNVAVVQAGSDAIIKAVLLKNY